MDEWLRKGLGLIELLIAMTAASILILILYHIDLISVKVHTEMRDEWYCMQSLRVAALQLNEDLGQAACLLPQDLKIAVDNGELFIAGVPVTSQHGGLGPSSIIPPPYFSLIVSTHGNSIELDSIDVDGDGKADYWADLGLITDNGPCLISHGYSRGNLFIPVTTSHTIEPGKRAIPAIHYALKADGLYRNDQLLAESIVSFEPKLASNELNIILKARYHGKEKELIVPYALQ
jgi:prepilin-type N-terminal cleavage/methylation domain-containing protein